MFNSEDCLADDSSKVSILPASPGFGYYELSYTMIRATAPSGTVKVGDEAGIFRNCNRRIRRRIRQQERREHHALCQRPVGDETLSQPTHKTTATTDTSGNLEYIFREPGYYTMPYSMLTPDDTNV